MRAAIRLLALGAVLAAGAARADDLPPSPTRFVTDAGGFLPAPERQALDARLEGSARATGQQVILWIGDLPAGASVEDFATRAFERWGVGRKGRDDGVAIFFFPNDRAVRIEVGYGVEERLPDARAARLIREEIVPRLASGDRAGAARAAVEGVLAALGGAAAPEPAAERPPVRLRPWHLALFALGGLFFLWLIITNPGLAIYLLMNLMGGGGRGGGGGGFSGGGGGFSGGGGRSGGGGATGRW